MTWVLFILIMGGSTSQATAEFHTKLGCDTAALAVGTQYQEALRKRGSSADVLILCVPNDPVQM